MPIDAGEGKSAGAGDAGRGGFFLGAILGWSEFFFGVAYDARARGVFGFVGGEGWPAVYWFYGETDRFFFSLWIRGAFGALLLAGGVLVF